MFAGYELHLQNYFAYPNITPEAVRLMIEELKEKGFTFNMDTAAYFEDGRIKNVYLNGEYGGFAIHIMQK